MTDLKKLLEDQEKQAKQIEANYHQIIGGINMLKYLIEQEATQDEDITQYKIVDGEKVEVIPEPFIMEEDELP